MATVLVQCGNAVTEQHSEALKVWFVSVHGGVTSLSKDYGHSLFSDSLLVGTTGKILLDLSMAFV